MTLHAIIITGSREWPWRHRSAIHGVILQLPIGALVIHGHNHRGADRFAHELFSQVLPNRPVEWAMPAPWEACGKPGGTVRNRAMLAALLALRDGGAEVAVHAFPLPQGSGTQHMMRIAAAAGVRVVDHGEKTE